MALEKQIRRDRLEIVGLYNHIQLRERTDIFEDGIKISTSFHRRTLDPGADLTREDTLVQDVCELVWTAENQLAWETYKASINNE